MNTNQLTRLTTQDLNKAEIVTDSLIVSERTNRQHKNILETIKKYEQDLRDFGGVAFQTQTFQTNGGDQEREVVLLNEGQTTFLITLLRNNKQVVQFKKDIVKAFIFMKHELTARVETRSIGKAIRSDLTRSISENVPESNFKNFAHSNYTRLVYKKVLGMQVNKWKDQQDLPKKSKVRDHLNKDQLEQVQVLESKIANIIEFNTDLGPKDLYKKISDFIKSI